MPRKTCNRVARVATAVAVSREAAGITGAVAITARVDAEKAVVPVARVMAVGVPVNSVAGTAGTAVTAPTAAVAHARAPARAATAAVSAGKGSVSRAAVRRL